MLKNSLPKVIFCVICLTLIGPTQIVYSQGGDELEPRQIISAQGNDEIRFEYLTTEQGLSSDWIEYILQDQRGFIWITTTKGLNRYDGYHVKVYLPDEDNPYSLNVPGLRHIYEDDQGFLWLATNGGGLNKFDPLTERAVHFTHDPDDPTSISDDDIRVMAVDRDGILWLGTRNAGLNKFDPATETFTRYRHDPSDPTSLGDDYVEAIFEDSAGVLWVGAREAGLLRFDRESETFTPYRHNPDDPTTISDDTVKAIYEDAQGRLWVGTRNAGLNLFNRETGTFTQYRYNPDDPTTISDDYVQCIKPVNNEDTPGWLWICTDSGGLNKFDPASGTFIRYQHDLLNPDSLSNNDVVSIYEGYSGIVWVATFGGINKFVPLSQQFPYYRQTVGSSTTLSDNDIQAIYQDETGLIWLGTDSGGLNRFNRETGTYTHYRHDPNNPNTLLDDDVEVIVGGEPGFLWLGTRHDGLSKFEIATETFTHYLPDPDRPDAIPSGSIETIYQAADGLVWVGLDGGGLTKFDPVSETFTAYRHDPDNLHSISDNVILSVYQDRAGTLWIGTKGHGLNKFNPDTETFTRYAHDPDNPNSLEHDQINDIYQDQSGTLWISTGIFLNKFDPMTETFTRYNDGLVNQWVKNIVEDDSGGLWLVGDNNLHYFDPKTETTILYDERDGIQKPLQNADKDERTGEILLGTVNGFHIFHPDRLQAHSYLPPIVVTNFKRFNQEVSIGPESPLQKSIIDTTDIALSYRDYIISFEFAALDYTAPEQIQYQYKLEGLEEAWNDVNYTHRFASYTTLPPGNYTFRVRATNSKGVWSNQEAAVALTITPPWWQTWWAYILYFFATAGLILGYVRWRLNTSEAQKRQLEIQVIERTRELEIAREKAEAANQAKSKFLANMSHELRTPLNAILGYAQILKQDATVLDHQQRGVTIIEKSGEHLLHLINDVLDLAKVEAEKIQLDLKSFHLPDLIAEVDAMMQVQANSKNLTCLTQTQILPARVRGDEKRLRQILVNLLGNAIKFTEQGGVVLAIFPLNDDVIRFEVRDTGIGIASHRLENIFDHFEQGDDPGTLETGTGLGLAISKELVALMGGTLRVKSETDRGSTFWFDIYLPKANDLHQAALESGEAIIGIKDQSPKILVVDDNNDNRNVINDMLTPLGFVIAEAENGEAGLAQIATFAPDAIILDLVMPKLGRLEMIKRIRQKPALNNMVLIVSSASSYQEDQTQSLAVGANAFIPKPVDITLLLNTLRQQLHLEWVYGEIAAKPEPAVTSINLPMVVPPDDAMKEMRHLALIGDVLALKNYVQALEHDNPHLSRFTTKVQNLTNSFQIDQLLLFLEA